MSAFVVRIADPTLHKNPYYGEQPTDRARGFASCRVGVRVAVLNECAQCGPANLDQRTSDETWTRDTERLYSPRVMPIPRAEGEPRSGRD